MSDLRNELDTIVVETTEETFDKNTVPQELVVNLDKWKWGSYGWTSPASLIFTATWRKYFYPDEDCCKIWAKDENNAPIEGGYSIRTEDESITIPVLAKYDLCNGFCSANSGMQGSRAIEKMRSLKRLNIDFDSSQRTVFNLKLFATILNQINELNSEQALRVLQYQILIAKTIKNKRLDTNAELQQATSNNFNAMNFLSKTADPELTKCVAAACFDLLFSPHGLTIEGVSDYKTAADARAQKPGDLSLQKNEKVLIAVEVKDKTQHIDWNNIDRAKKIISANPDLVNFIFLLESREATITDVIQEMVRSDQFQSGECNKITFLALHDLFLLTESIYDEDTISSKVGYYMSIAPAVKPETKHSWIEETKANNY